MTNREFIASPLGVVCDFDGTATLLDVGDEISKHFGGLAQWEAATARFRSGALDTRGVIESIYRDVGASEAEVRAFAAEHGRLRPGFADLVAACRARGTRFILASGGLRQYIEAVLEKELDAELRAHVEIRANEGVFPSREGDLVRVRFPGDVASRELGCVACGSCKRVAVRDLRAAGAAQVIGIGDGFADRCLAQFADRVFARAGSYLDKHCQASSVERVPFETLHAAAEAVTTFR